MKILHICTSDNNGGAAIAAMRLHRAMQSEGIDSTFFALDRSITDDISIKTVQQRKKIIKSLIGSIKLILFRKTKLSDKKGLFSDMSYGYKIGQFLDLQQFDIIYLHWINSNFLSLIGLEEILKTGKKVYWFLHDMFPITGGCHHSFECNGYFQNCGLCPYMKTNKPKDFSYKQLKRKHKILDKYDNLTFISPSKWLTECAKSSSLGQKHAVQCIPNIANDKYFNKQDKTFCKNLLGIQTNVNYIAFGAVSALSNPYKGFEYLEEALRILKERKVSCNLLVFGSSYNKQIEERLPYKCHFLGYLHDVYTLNLLYNSAEVFCVPSLAETFCQTALESVFCGTPVVAFNIGGLPDIVSENTGYLAEYKDAEDLANGIEQCLKRKSIDNSAIKEKCNPHAVVSMHKKMWGAIKK